MLKEYFDSHEHKDQPPRQLRLTAEAGAQRERLPGPPQRTEERWSDPMKVMAGRIST